MRAHPFFVTVAWCLFKSLLFPSYATRCRYDIALRQVLVAMLAEGALESPSVLVLAFHSSLLLVEGSSDGSAPGDRFLSPGRMCSFTPFRLRSVASALSLLGSGLFCLLWICRFTVGSSGAFPRGKFWGSREGWVFSSLHGEFCLTLFLSFPGCSHPGLGRVPPSPSRVCGFPHSIVTKPALVSCVVFLQDGVPLSGLDL